MLTILEIVSNPISWFSKYSCPYGGGEVRAFEILKEFLEMRNKILVLTSSRTSLFASLRNYKNFREIKVFTPSIVSKVEAIFSGFIWIMLTSLLFIAKKDLFLRYRICIASNTNITDVLPAWLHHKLFHSKLIVVVQVTGFQKSFGMSFRRARSFGIPFAWAMLFQLTNALTLRLMKEASLLIAISEPIYKELKTLGFEDQKIVRSSMGVRLKEIPETPKKKTYLGVFIGRVEESKGIFDLLKAWAIVKSFEPSAKLIIIGSGSCLNRAKTWSRIHGLSENVSFTGFVSGAKRFYLMSKAKLAILPSKGSEGFCLSVLEALSCGLPVVCYDHPTIKDIFSSFKSVFLTPSGNIPLLAEEIIRIAKKEDLEKISNLARNEASLFDWKNVARKELRAILNC